MCVKMVLRDDIIQVIIEKEPDGQGGFIIKNQLETHIECKASLNISPEVATAYGTHGEQVLHVVSRTQLSKEAFYLFNGTKFTVRAQSDNKRLFYSTLVEVK